MPSVRDLPADQLDALQAAMAETVAPQLPACASPAHIVIHPNPRCVCGEVAWDDWNQEAYRAESQARGEGPQDPPVGPGVPD